MMDDDFTYYDSDYARPWWSTHTHKNKIERLEKKLTFWKDQEKQTEPGSTGYLSEKWCKIMVEGYEKALQQALKEG